MDKSTQKIIDNINNMPQEKRARLWGLAPSDHSYFKVFDKRFRKLGGISSKILKRIGG